MFQFGSVLWLRCHRLFYSTYGKWTYRWSQFNFRHFALYDMHCIIIQIYIWYVSSICVVLVTLSTYRPEGKFACSGWLLTHLPLHSIYSINRSKNANINYIALVKHPPFRMDVIKFSNNFHSVCVFEGAKQAWLVWGHIISASPMPISYPDHLAVDEWNGEFYWYHFSWPNASCPSHSLTRAWLTMVRRTDSAIPKHNSRQQLSLDP